MKGSSRGVVYGGGTVSPVSDQTRERGVFKVDPHIIHPLRVIPVPTPGVNSDGPPRVPVLLRPLPVCDPDPVFPDPPTDTTLQVPHGSRVPDDSRTPDDFRTPDDSRTSGDSRTPGLLPCHPGTSRYPGVLPLDLVHTPSTPGTRRPLLGPPPSLVVSSGHEDSSFSSGLLSSFPFTLVVFMTLREPLFSEVLGFSPNRVVSMEFR